MHSRAVSGLGYVVGACALGTLFWGGLYSVSGVLDRGGGPIAPIGLVPVETDSAAMLAEIFAEAERIRGEFVLAVKGMVRERPEGTINPKMKTGEVEIEVSELLARDLNDLAVERTMLESLKAARSVREVFIINGLVHGNIPRALNGEYIGTRIYKE